MAQDISQGTREFDGQRPLITTGDEGPGAALLGAIPLGQVPEEGADATVPGAGHRRGQRGAVGVQEESGLPLAGDVVARDHVLDAGYPELNPGHPVGRVIADDQVLEERGADGDDRAGPGRDRPGPIEVKRLAGSLYHAPGLPLARPGEDRDVILTHRRLLGAVVAVGGPEGSLAACRVVGELLAIDGTEAIVGRRRKRRRQGDAADVGRRERAEVRGSMIALEEDSLPDVLIGARDPAEPSLPRVFATDEVGWTRAVISDPVMRDRPVSRGEPEQAPCCRSASQRTWGSHDAVTLDDALLDRFGPAQNRGLGVAPEAGQRDQPVPVELGLSRPGEEERRAAPQFAVFDRCPQHVVGVDRAVLGLLAVDVHDLHVLDGKVGHPAGWVGRPESQADVDLRCAQDGHILQARAVAAEPDRGAIAARQLALLGRKRLAVLGLEDDVIWSARRRRGHGRREAMVQRENECVERDPAPLLVRPRQGVPAGCEPECRRPRPCRRRPASGIGQVLERDRRGCVHGERVIAAHTRLAERLHVGAIPDPNIPGAGAGHVDLVADPVAHRVDPPWCLVPALAPEACESSRAVGNELEEGMGATHAGQCHMSRNSKRAAEGKDAFSEMDLATAATTGLVERLLKLPAGDPGAKSHQDRLRLLRCLHMQGEWAAPAPGPALPGMDPDLVGAGFKRIGNVEPQGILAAVGRLGDPDSLLPGLAEIDEPPGEVRPAGEIAAENAG